METKEVKHLYRSKSKKILAGIAGGIGDYFGIDPVFIRILFLIFAISTLGFAILLYLGMWVVMPAENSLHKSSAGSLKENIDEIGEKTGDVIKEVRKRDPNKVIGMILIFVGLVFFLQQIGFFSLFAAFTWIFNLWPLVIVVFGLLLYFRGGK